MFAIRIEAVPHRLLSLKSPLIFGPLGLSQHPYFLRDLGRMELTVNVDDITPYAITQYREPVRHFVDVLHAHAEDKNRKTLLQYLHVKLTCYGRQIWDQIFEDELRHPQHPSLGGFIDLDSYERHTS